MQEPRKAAVRVARKTRPLHHQLYSSSYITEYLGWGFGRLIHRLHQYFLGHFVVSCIRSLKWRVYVPDLVSVKASENLRRSTVVTSKQSLLSAAGLESSVGEGQILSGVVRLFIFMLSIFIQKQNGRSVSDEFGVEF